MLRPEASNEPPARLLMLLLLSVARPAAGHALPSAGASPHTEPTGRGGGSVELPASHPLPPGADGTVGAAYSEGGRIGPCATDSG